MGRKEIWEAGAIGFAAVGLLTLLWTVYPLVAIGPESGDFGSWLILSDSILGGLELLTAAAFLGLWAREERKQAGKEGNGKGE